MSTFFELSALDTDTVFTGSLVFGGGTNGAVPVVTDPSVQLSSLQTGSWLGLQNTFGAMTLNTLSGSLTGGHWWGIDYSWGTYHIPSESYDRTDTTSNLFPYPDQGLSPGDWNPFPVPVAPPEPVLPPRDLTRYRKAYSSVRHQPVRVRLVRGTGTSNS